VRRHAKAPSAGSTQATGSSRGLFRRAFATRGASLGFTGTGAPSSRPLRATLAVLALAIAAFAVTAAPASAADPVLGQPTVSNVQGASAHLSAELKPNGLGGFWGFQYSTDGGSSWSAFGFGQGTVTAGSGPTTVEYDLQGLAPATHYDVRLGFQTFKGFELGPFFSGPKSELTTFAVNPPAVIATDNAGDVAYTTAKASGKVKRPDPVGADPITDPAIDLNCHFEVIADAQFQDNLTNSRPGFEGATPVDCEPNPVKAAGDSDVTAHLENLANNTTYHLRLSVANAGGSDAKVAASTFTTLEVDPPTVVSIENATGVEYTQAQVKGVVKRPDTSDDPAFDVNCNFEYISDAQFKENEEDLSQPGFTGATPVPCNPNPVTAADTAPGTTREVTATLPGLTASTTYHLRLSATNAGGTDSKEAVSTFTTLGPVSKPVVIETGEATAIGKRSAQASGKVERPAGADPAFDTSCRFEYIPDAQFDANPPGEEFAGAGQALCNEAPFYAPITSPEPGHPAVSAHVTAELVPLEPGTEYHLRLVAENGGGTASKDAAGTFTTAPVVPPTATIDSITEVTYTTFRITGTADPGNQGDYPFFQYSIAGTEEWSPPGVGRLGSQEPGSPPAQFSEQKPFICSGGDPYCAGPPLKPGTTYQVRMGAQDLEEGISHYSPEPYPEFTTKGTTTPPSASCNPVTDVTGTSAHISCTVDTHAPAGPLPDEAKAAYRTDWHFECTPECPSGLGSGTIEAEEGSQAIEVDVKNLEANAHYQIKLIAHNSLGTVETPGQAFDTLKIPPSVQQTPGASDGEGGYTLAGIVNPNNNPITGCTFEWGPDAPKYAFKAACSPIPTPRNEVQSITTNGGTGTNTFTLSYRGQSTSELPRAPASASASEVEAALQALPSIGAGNVEVSGSYIVTFTGALAGTNVDLLTAQGPSIDVRTLTNGGNSFPTTVEAHLSGLNPGVDYHALLVVTYGAGAEAKGADQKFVATLAEKEPACPNEQLRKENNSTALPECRAYEMVTDPHKEGKSAELVDFSSGDAVQYASKAPNLANSGFALVASFNPYVATRTPFGWQTIPNLNGPSGSLLDAPEHVDTHFSPRGLFSKDLRSSVWALRKLGGDFKSAYFRRPDGRFEAIGPGTVETIRSERDAMFEASDDLSHLLLSPLRLSYPIGFPSTATPGIYEFVDISDDPAGRVDLDNTGAPACNAGLVPAIANALSADGEVVHYTTKGCGTDQLWARVGGKTSYEVSASQCDRIATDPGGLCNGPVGPTACSHAESAGGEEVGTDCRGARFQGVSEDGSRVYFTTTQQLVDADIDQANDLYACDIPTTPQALIDKANPCAAFRQVSVAETGAAQVENVLTTSDDGSTVLFTAKGVLADNEDAFGEEAAAGDHNLYLWRTDSAHPTGQTTFVGRLDSNDVGRSGQSTPDGRYLLFTTANQLLDTDTDSARDVYRYDVENAEMTRVSTKASGLGGNADQFDARILASAPHAEAPLLYHNTHSAISDDGQKVVFATAEPLEPSDGNAAEDAYIWTPGKVSLISTGAVGGGLADGSNSGAGGLPAIDGSGLDVYFETAGTLTPADNDASGDIYDARVGGGFGFAQSSCSGEACQPPVSTPPQPPAPGSGRAGPGNRPLPKRCPKGKVKTHGKCTKKSPKKHSGKKHPGKKASHKQGGGK
jgi:hypothetical protein